MRKNYAAEAAEAGAWRALFVVSAFFLALLLSHTEDSLWLWCIDVGVVSSLCTYLFAGKTLTTIAVAGDVVQYRTRGQAQIHVDSFANIRAAACFNSFCTSCAMAGSAISFLAVLGPWP